MKKLLALLLCLVMLFAAACDGDSGNDSSVVDESAVSTDTSAVASEDGSSAADESKEDKSTGERFDENGKYIALNYDVMKIMKLTQWDMSAEGILLSNGAQRRENTYKKLAQKAMENIKEDGYNTVLFQIRPFADSFYQSEYYPLSYFVSGSYANQTISYDPVEILITEAHKLGLSIHGWFNPMRCMTNKQIEQIPGDWAITDWYKVMGDATNEKGEYMFAGTDAGGTARLYLNPAYEEVRQLIINGVREICEKYNVDGIFMDDYFYPEEVKTNTKLDNLAYRARTDGSSTRAEFRRNNVNALVRGIYATIKDYDPNLIYGISPNGHIEHAYENECADIYTWCKDEGYCDIMYPQFYYGMIHGQCSISVLMKKWDSIMTNERIKLVPILTTHKVGLEDQWAITPIGKSEWTTFDDILLESLVYMLVNEYRDIAGTGFFSYQYFYGAARTLAIATEIEKFRYLIHDYDTLIGADKATIKEYFTGKGVDISALAAEWDSRLVNSGFDMLFNMDE